MIVHSDVFEWFTHGDTIPVMTQAVTENALYRGITRSCVREGERRRGILGDATVTSTPDGPRGRGV